MDRQLFRQAIGKVLAGFVLVALLLFLPAGTLRYPNAWLLIALLFVPMITAGFFMLFKSPELLRKRLNSKENEGEQRQVVALSALMFVAAFVLAGLNFRFGWIVMPRWIVWAASAVFLLAYALYAEVLRENVWLSRTVEVQEGQRVVDTGLYGLVRHPMYAATLLLFLSMPLILGSPLSFCLLLLYLPVLAKRIRNEEAVLEEGLAGYKAYKERVKYRLFPGLW